MFRGLARRWLLRARIHDVPEGYALDPHTLEYLYLIQQRKRLSLAASIGRLRPRSWLLLPLIVPVVVAKAIDLWIANQTIRAMINEHDLQQRIDQGNPSP